MRSGKTIVIGFILVTALFLQSGRLFAQKRLSYIAEGHSTVSWLGINTWSPAYNNRWKDIKLDFNSVFGYGFGIGVEYSLSHKVGAGALLRYNNWGGSIYAARNGSASFLELDIRYKSLNIPVWISYDLVKRKRSRYKIKAGGGFDRTFALGFVPTNNYGSVPEIKANTDIDGFFLLAGTEMEVLLKDHLSVIIGIELNSDWMFNPDRIQDFGGFFGQDRIPLKYNLLMFYLGLKLQ